MNVLKGMVLVAGLATAGSVVVNLNAGTQDVSLIEKSTPIQYQVPDNATQSQKDCYKIMSEVSLSQFSALKSKEEGHKRAMKNCGINP